MEKVALPLKWKIIGVNVILLLVTVFFLVSFASSLFNEDKSASIYERTLESSLSMAERLTVFFKSNSNSFSLLQSVSKQSTPSPDLLRDIFNRNEALISYTHFNRYRGELDLVIHLENDLYLKSHELTKEYFLGLFLKKQLKSKAVLQVMRLEGDENFVLLQSYRSGDDIYAAFFNLEQALKNLNEQSRFKQLVFINETLLSSRKISKSLKKELSSLRTANLEEKGARVVQVKTDRDGFLVGLAPVNQDVLAMSAVSDGLIYRASSFLRKQSIYFSLFIFALTVLIGVLLSRRMTSDLGRLHDASLAFAKGNFEQDLHVSSRDEIGSLATTFKQMGSDILRYIDEMKDKARLVQEMEVARLVQESFIPNERGSFGSIQLNSVYQAASECGGDWWGSFRFGDSVVLVVADATGHGVPAALMTATASGCLHQLEHECQQGKRVSITPSEVLDVLNFSISKMGGRIHMTAFALVLDCRTGIGHYSNASHNAPIYIPGALEEAGSSLTKEDLLPLMQGNSTRLGESLDSRYDDVNFSMKPGDFLLLFSDGLVEQENEEGKPWGNRRFYKAVIEQLNSSSNVDGASSIPSSLLASMADFSGKSIWDDDITIISLAFASEQMLDVAEIPPVYNRDNQLLICNEGNEKVYGNYWQQYPFRSVISGDGQRKYFEKVRDSGLDFKELFGAIITHKEFQVDSTQKANESIEEGLSYLNFSGYFDSPKAPFELMAKEIVSNAIYHQSQLTSSKDRTEEFVLGKSKWVKVDLFQSELGVGVMVEDSSGLLDFDEFRTSIIRAYIEKEPSQKAGGAGLGLYLLFQNANRVFIDVKKGSSTKVLGFIEKERRYKNYRSKTTSFYFNERLV